jgi:hypothetical protein
MMRSSARWARRLGALVMTLVVLATVGAGLLAWRLSQGPVSLPPLARMIEARAAELGLGARLSVGDAALVWEGFGAAVDRPIDLRLTDVRVIDAEGATVAAVPEGSVSLGLRALLLGRIEPRAIELRDASLTLLRAEDGAVTVDLGPRGSDGAAARGGADAGLAETLFGELGAGHGEAPRHAWITDLERVRIRGAELKVIDRQLGATWHIPDATLDLRRDADGIALALDGAAVAGEARIALTAAGKVAAGGAGRLAVDLAPVAPADLAQALPGLAALSALDAPISGTVTIALGAGFALESGTVAARLGAGHARLPEGGTVPITSARAGLRITAGAVTLDRAELVLPGTHGPAPTISATATARRDGADWTVEAAASLDRVAVADLPGLWPEGVGPGERAWITGNITDGTVTGARVQFAGALDPATFAVAPTTLTGTIEVDGATVHYLRPMPPVTGVAAEVTLGLATVVVTTRGGAVGEIRPTEATIVLSDLDARPQWADIAVRIETGVPAAIELLKHPKLALFTSREPPPAGITGEAEIDLALRFPLLDALTVDEIEAKASAQITGGGVPDVVLGKPVTAARLSLEASQDALSVEGAGKLAGLDSAFTYEVDFRAGPANQVIERATLRLAPQPDVLATFGVDPAPFLDGAVGGEARLAIRRDRQASVTLRADLTRARLTLDELGWAKPAGTVAAAEGTLRLAGPRLVSAELTRLEGQGLAARGRAAFDRQGKLERIEVTDLRLGESRLSGDVRPPSRAGEPWRISMRGALLDLSGRSQRASRGTAPARQAETPPFAVDARLDRVVLGEGRDTRNVVVSLSHDGRRIAALDAQGAVGGRGSYTARLQRAGSGRSLDLRSDDAGALLAALDVMGSMAGGRLAVTAQFDDSKPSSPLSGEATIEEFRLRDAPAIGRLLQAMTLYGLLEVARGPGLSFSTLIAPFALENDTLELRDARAYGPSLGFTAKGTVDLARDTLALEGTIVPAYFFNSLLGHIPLIGRIFAPERGGGVFAATYRVRGTLADPEVSVNPLAALTPGFLRGLFGFLDPGEGSSSGTAPPAPQPFPPHGDMRGSGG